MIKIVQYIIVENQCFFFAENSSKGMSESDVSRLINLGFTDLSEERFKTITKQVG